MQLPDLGYLNGAKVTPLKSISSVKNDDICACSAIRVQDGCYCFVHLELIREDTLELRARLYGILFYLNG